MKSEIDTNGLSKEAAAKVVEYEAMLKEAGIWDKVKNFWIAKSYDLAKHPMTAPIAGLTLGGLSYGLGSLIESIYDKKKDKEFQKNYENSVNTLMTDPTFKGKEDKVKERMFEIASLSPTVAARPFIAKPLLKRSITKGLSDEDADRLLNMEVNQKLIETTPSRKPAIVQGLQGGSIHKFLSSDIPQIIPQIAQNTDKALESPTGNMIPIGKKPLFGPQPTRPETQMDVIQGMKPFLENYKKYVGAFPAGLEGIDINNPLSLAKAQEYLHSHQEVYNKMTQQISDIANKALKKESQVLPQFLEKVALPSAITRGILGAAAAATAGLTFGAVEQLAKYKETQNKNKGIEDSWKQIDSYLKKKSEEGDSLIGRGVDYKDKETQNRAKEVFTTLSNVAPAIAQDPVLGRSIVNSVMSTQGFFDQATLKTLTDIQKNINQNNEYKSPFAGKPFAKGFDSGFQMAGGREFIKQIAKGKTDED